MLSYIQNQILANLLRSETGLRYSQAQPEGIENDLYKYHLKFLIDKNLVGKVEQLYKLTDKGKRYVHRMDVLGDVKKYFKASVIAYVFRNNKKELMMQQRLRHPYYGDTMSVAGKIIPGELITDAAIRKVKEETGLVADFKFIGVIRIIAYSYDGSLIEDTLYHICTANEPKGKLIDTNKFGHNFWVPKDKVSEQIKNNVTNSKFRNKIILEDIWEKSPHLFYYEDKFKMKKY